MNIVADCEAVSQSGFVMSLAGFDHVFQAAAPQEVGSGLVYSVVPPPVLALLKIVSYLDDPQRRAKDLLDFRSLMQRYERDSERIFSDVVFHADLPDIEFAGAFLLGLDLQAIATKGDVSLVGSFVAKMIKAEESMVKPSDDDWATRNASYFQQQLFAFTKGFKGVGDGRNIINENHVLAAEVTRVLRCPRMYTT